MATHKVIFVRCDGCGTSSLPTHLIIIDLLNLSVPAPDSVTSARSHAAAKGWRHTASGKDLCANCAPGKPTGKSTGTGLLSHIPHPHFHGWGHH
jgi:hypothetical protein